MTMSMRGVQGRGAREVRAMSQAFASRVVQLRAMG